VTPGQISRPCPRRLGGRLPALLAALVALVLAACSGPILANPPAERPSPAPRTPAPFVAADPQPVVFPRDDGPHDRLTEWWYYTGHLAAADGRTFGFEYVEFRAERGGFPVSWASHLAITDESGARFAYGQRSEVGPQVDRSPRDAAGTPTGFSFSLAGSGPGTGTGPAGSSTSTGTGTPWTMAGSGGHDTLSALTGPAEAAGTTMPNGFGLQLALTALGPPVLHDGDGWVDFGAAGGSYYYSRPRMSAAGTLDVNGEPVAVTGTAWFDHQWGDFIAVGGGGWDWFAVNLDDGTDLTISLVRGADGTDALVYGTLVHSDGTSSHLAGDQIAVETLGHWTSPRTGATYPSGWRVRLAGAGLDLVVTPTLRDQELDTRSTTGVVYWEGSERVSGTRGGRPVAGKGYVELTGYAAGAASAP
jgi:predicted secreted hydrolase